MTGWYPDPGGGRRLRWWDGYRWTPYTAAYPRQLPPLDSAVAAMKRHDAGRWGWRPVTGPIVALITIIALSQIALRWEPDQGSGKVVFVAVGNLIIEGALVLALYASGRQVAARYGGWGRTFGWCRPRWKDLPAAGLGFLVALGIRFVIALALGVLTRGAATRQSENLRVGHVTPWGVVLLVVIAVIIAPLTEELMFRGLLLRTFMRRWRFWPAAIASSVIFGLFHTYEVATLLGAVTLALAVGSMALVNCYLVRVTNRLLPGVYVHAASNALAVLVAVVVA